MKYQPARHLVLLPTIVATLFVVGAIPGALANGAVISARSAMAVPVAGGKGVATPIGNDGSFKFVGLKAGQKYRVAITSTTVRRQTQGATFGEKVNAGLKHGGMADRISMNVTVARQIRALDVDGAPIEVAVDRDGSLVGRVASL
jgi:hypothetical protein